jgi:hypothetical protein
MSEVVLLSANIEDDSEFAAVQRATPTAAKLGETSIPELVKIKTIEPQPIEVELAELLKRHPQRELVIGKFEEATEIFNRLGAKEKLKSGYEAPEGPTIGLTKNSAGMVRLHEIGVIDDSRFEEERATLAETAFVKLYMDQNAHAAIVGERENLTIKILMLRQQLWVEAQKQALMEPEQESKIENPSQSINL